MLYAVRNSVPYSGRDFMFELVSAIVLIDSVTNWVASV